MLTKRETRTSVSNHLAPELWVNKYADYLYAYAYARIDDQELARDLVQETFLGALESFDKFDGLSSEKTWLTAILKNKIFDVYRKMSSGLGKQSAVRTFEGEDNFFDSSNGHWNEEHNPAAFIIEEPDIFNDQEFQAVLHLCMKKLPPLWMSVFKMKHLDEESSETICAELRLSSSNFWVIIHRAKLNLRSCLQKKWI